MPPLSEATTEASMLSRRTLNLSNPDLICHVRNLGLKKISRFSSVPWHVLAVGTHHDVLCQAYMEKFKYSNTETFDLWEAWADASGMPVKDIMSSWIEP